MAKVAGSFWVDGTTLHYVDSTAVEWFFTGTDLGAAAGAVYGSVWASGSDATIRYIDNALHQRSVACSLFASRPGSVAGSLWVQNTFSGNNQLNVISAASQYYAHTDTHGDVATTHSDSHSDVAASHSDGHSDVGASHSDGHTDSGCHGDAAHADYHFDASQGHIDDNLPIHHDIDQYDDHEDEAHGDTSACGQHGDVHEDITAGFGGGSLGNSPFAEHHDSHSDWSSGTHGDGHDDSTSGHSDSHSDSATGHSDAHTDVTVAHTDTHTDQPTSLGA